MIDPLLIEEQIGQILREDIGFGDLTSTIMIDEDTTGVFDVNAREEIVVAGMAVAAAIFKRCEPGCTFEPKVNDGDHITDGTTMARVSGKARGLLTAERSALNMLQHLSGIATLTSEYVKEIEGTGATLIDTRKTTPGLRALEKHAVTCGGGRNHRLALDGGVLVKDNHIAVCGGLTAAIQRAKSQVPTLTRCRSNATTWIKSKKRSKPAQIHSYWTTCPRTRCAKPPRSSTVGSPSRLPAALRWRPSVPRRIRRRSHLDRQNNPVSAIRGYRPRRHRDLNPDRSHGD